MSLMEKSAKLNALLFSLIELTLVLFLLFFFAFWARWKSEGEGKSCRPLPLSTPHVPVLT